MNILKKSATFLFIGIIAIFSGRILSGQANRITLDGIIADIPERWWEGGWDKVIELNQFINQVCILKRDKYSRFIDTCKHDSRINRG